MVKPVRRSNRGQIKAGCKVGFAKEKLLKTCVLRSFSFDAADGGRTRTLSPERDFKSLVSANFTTAAHNINYNTTEPIFCQEKARAALCYHLFTVHLKKVLFLSAVSCYNKSRYDRRVVAEQSWGETALPGHCPQGLAGGKIKKRGESNVGYDQVQHRRCILRPG